MSSFMDYAGGLPKVGGVGIPRKPAGPPQIGISTGPGSPYAPAPTQYGKPMPKPVDAPDPHGTADAPAPAGPKPDLRHPAALPAAPQADPGIMGFPGSVRPMADPAPNVPAPASAQVGVKTEPRGDNPIQAPTATPSTASFQAAANPTQSPTPTASPGIGLQAQPYGSAPPATFRQYLGQTEGPRAVARYDKMNIGSGDPYRDSLMAKMSNPGMSQEGGIGVYRGNSGDSGDGPSVADRNALTRVTAQNQLAAYDTTAANIRGIDGQVNNQNPNTVVAADVNGLRDPQGRAMIEGKFGMTPGSIPPPGNGSGTYDSTNVGPQDRVSPRVQGLHNVLHSNIPLHSKMAYAASSQAAIPGSEHSRLFDAWMQRQAASEANWQHELNGYGNMANPRDQKFHSDMGHLGYKFVSR